MAPMMKNVTLGTRELQLLQRTMQLVVKLHADAKDRGVTLQPAEEQELISGLNAVHRMLYGE